MAHQQRIGSSGTGGFPFPSGLAPQDQTSAVTSRPAAPSRLATTAEPVPRQEASMMAMQNNDALMAALQGIAPEQLSIIVHALQSGQLPMPPPSHQEQVSVKIATSGSHVPPLPHIGAHDSDFASPPQKQVDGSDKEDGEVDDNGLREQPLATEPTRVVSHGKSSETVPAPRHGSHYLKNPISAKSNQIGSASRKASEEFVCALVEAGVSFQGIAKHVKRKAALRHMFQNLQLPIVEEKPSMSPHSAASNLRQKSILSRSLPTQKPKTDEEAEQKRKEYLAKLQAARKTSSSTTTVSAKAQTQRVEVLSGQAESHEVIESTSGQPVPRAPPKFNREEVQRRIKMLEAAQASKKALATASTGAAALAGPESKANMLHIPIAVQPGTGETPTFGLGSGLADARNQVSMQTPTSGLLTPAKVLGKRSYQHYSTGESGSPTPQQMPTHWQNSDTQQSHRSLSTGSSGLPGLFGSMLPGLSAYGSPFSVQPGLQASYFAADPIEQSPTESRSHSVVPGVTPSTQSAAQMPASPALPVPISGKEATGEAVNLGIFRTYSAASAPFETTLETPAKRPFGQSPYEPADEKMIIEVSSEDDDDDEAQGSRFRALGHDTLSEHQNTLNFDMPSLRDLPAKYNHGKQSGSGSAPGTPTSMTPGALEYRRKMLELEEAKRRLTELEMRKKNKPDVKAEDISVDHGTGEGAVPRPQSVAQPIAAVVDSAFSNSSTLQNMSAQPTFFKQDELDRTKQELAARIAALNQKRLLAKQPNSQLHGFASAIVAEEQVPERENLSSGGVNVQSGVLDQTSPDSGGMHITQSADNTTSSEVSALKSAEKYGLAKNAVHDRFLHNLVPTDSEAIDEDVDLHGKGAEDNGHAEVDGRIYTRSNSTEAEEASFADIYSAKGDSSDAEHGLRQASRFETDDHASSEDGSMDYASWSATGTDADVADETRDTVQEEAHYAAFDLPSSHLSREDGVKDLSPAGTFMPSARSTAATEETTREESSAISYGSSNSTHFRGVGQWKPESGSVKSRAPSALHHQAVDTTGSIEDLTEAGDRAPELQSQPQIQQKARSQNQDYATSHQSKAHYEPYRSLLGSFRDFRYHPQFTEHVGGGYKSLTYSKKIDATKTLCKTESDGGTCNDQYCKDQHFRDFDTTDNEIIQDLASEYPDRHPTAKAEYNKGLSALVQKLRDDGVTTNVAVIAPHIAAYRQQFLQDPTKIVDFEYWQERAHV